MNKLCSIAVIIAGLSIKTAFATVGSVPTLSSPASGATGVSLMPTLTWTTSGSFQKAEVLISTNSAFPSGASTDSFRNTALSIAVYPALVPNTTYYWTARDSGTTSGTGGWSAYATTQNFKTAAPPVSFQGNYSGYSYSRSISLNTTGTGCPVAAGSANELGFPVLIRLNGALGSGTQDSLIFKTVKHDSADIRFAKPDNTMLRYSIEQWNQTARTAAIWVQVDTVFANTNKAYFTMYWGNSAASDSQAGPAVFDTSGYGGFDVVWHLNGNWNDVGNIHTNTTINGSPTDTAAIIANGKKFSLATTDYFSDNTLEGSPAALTISMWAKEDTTGSSAGEMVTMGDNANLRDDSLGNGGIGANMEGISHNRNGGQDFCPNTTAGHVPRIHHKGWEHLAYTVNGSASSSNGHQQNLYINGARVASHDSATIWTQSFTGGTLTRLGEHTSNMAFGFGGVMNEVRIDRVARDSNWIKMCFYNQTPQNGLTQSPATGYIQGVNLPAQSLVTLGPIISPASLSYAVNPATYWQGVAIAADSARASGSVSSFTVSPTLPAGLSLNTTNGAITGSPTASQTATAYTVTANGPTGSATVPLTITVNGPPSGLSYAVNPSTCWQGITIPTNSATVTGGVDSFTVSSALPTGLSLNKTTGAINGTPTASQSATAYTVTAANQAGSATAVLSITVNGPPSGLSYAVNPVTYWQGVAITPNTSAVSGLGLSFTISPAIAAGLSLNQSSGQITGAPSASQSATPYTVTASNPAGSATAALSITVNGPPSGLSYAVNPATYWQGVAIAANTVAVTGSVDSFTVSSALPAGLSLNKTTGAITGAPSAPQSATGYTVSAWNTAGSATASLSITVNGPPSGLSYAVNPAAYWQGVAIAANTATVTGSVDSFNITPTLPTGLYLNKTTGAITGAANVSQSATVYTVTATNRAGAATVALGITINGPPLNFSYAVNPATWWQGVAIMTDTARVAGLIDSFTITPTLPAGVSLNKTTGAIGGTPLGSQPSSGYTVTATNAAGSATVSLTVIINANPSNLSYSTNPASWWQGVPIPADSARASGVVDSFLVSPALPSGLSINMFTGAITGTPARSQSSAIYTVTAKNASGSVMALLVIGINGPPTALRYSANPATFWQGAAIAPDTARTTGVVDSFTASPALPSGLSLDRAAGTISGTPIATQSATPYAIIAFNPAGTASVSLSITINAPPSALTYSVNPATYWQGVAIAADSARATGPVDSFTVSPALPAGLSLNRSAGLITGTPSGTQSATLYTVLASNPSGSVTAALTITIIGAPASPPALISPADNAWNIGANPTLSWSSSAGATAYTVQLSQNASFTFAVDTATSGVSWASPTILGGTKYYWRVCASNPGGASPWAMDSFCTVQSRAIYITKGWNVVSMNVHPRDSLTADVLGTLPGFVLAKTLALYYWPADGLDGFDTLYVTQGYQMYSNSPDTIRLSGPMVNVAATPIAMTTGWNLSPYLPQAAIPVDQAMTGIASQLVLVKNAAGQIYWPDTNYNLNSIGDMLPGQGYQIYMSKAASLVYPSAALSKGLARSGRETVSMPDARHFALSLNTGNNASILTRRVIIGGAIAPDSSEIGVYDSKGNLVGSGVVMHGAAAFPVWGRSELGKVAGGCEASEKMTFRLWNGKQEYPLEFYGRFEPRYAKDGIFIGNFVVPSANFISKFALANAYPNPFRSTIRICFDVPEIAGKEMQAVEINVYDIKGSVVGRLVNDKFKAGRYSASWDATGQTALSSNMYIVEMKAGQFAKQLKLFRIK